MRQSFSKFMDTLAMSLDIAALYEALSQATAAIGFQRFAYLSVHGSGRTKPMLISNYPIAWTERYFELHYDRFDPVLLQARTSNEPFLWGPAFHPSKEHASHGDFFEEASAFGIRAGFTVPLGATDRRFTLASFASDERAASVCHLVDAHASALQLVSLLFHRRAERVLSGDLHVAGVPLSKREYECLSWAAQGKSAWDIGRIIGRSKRTVTHHLENVRAKLGVKTTAQAVALLASALRDHSF